MPSVLSTRIEVGGRYAKKLYEVSAATNRCANASLGKAIHILLQDEHRDIGRANGTAVSRMVVSPRSKMRQNIAKSCSRAEKHRAGPNGSIVKAVRAKPLNTTICSALTQLRAQYIVSLRS